FNVLSVVKAALRSVYGVETIAEKLSGYYLADEIAGTYRGMLIAIPEAHWEVFGTMPTGQFVKVLKELAGKVVLDKLTKHPRGPKKQKLRRKHNRRQTHVSTARLLAQRGARQK